MSVLILEDIYGDLSKSDVEKYNEWKSLKHFDNDIIVAGNVYVESLRIFPELTLIELMDNLIDSYNWEFNMDYLSDCLYFYGMYNKECKRQRYKNEFNTIRPQIEDSFPYKSISRTDALLYFEYYNQCDNFEGWIENVGVIETQMIDNGIVNPTYEDILNNINAVLETSYELNSILGLLSTSLYFYHKRNPYSKEYLEKAKQPKRKLDRRDKND